tara:strand:+ start:1930 stop:2355 length:426 start_codon:yes stop_codon:yes gene_type:complete
MRTELTIKIIDHEWADTVELSGEELSKRRTIVGVYPRTKGVKSYTTMGRAMAATEKQLAGLNVGYVASAPEGAPLNRMLVKATERFDNSLFPDSPEDVTVSYYFLDLDAADRKRWTFIRSFHNSEETHFSKEQRKHDKAIT